MHSRHLKHHTSQICLSRDDTLKLQGTFEAVWTGLRALLCVQVLKENVTGANVPVPAAERTPGERRQGVGSSPERSQARRSNEVAKSGTQGQQVPHRELQLTSLSDSWNREFLGILTSPSMLLCAQVVLKGGLRLCTRYPERSANTDRSSLT